MPLLGRIAAALGSVALVAGLLAGSAVAAARPLVVTGFQSESDPLARIDASAAALGIVGVDGVSLTSSGASFAYPDARALQQLARAHRHHLRTEFLLSNFSDAIDDFSEPVAWRLLSSSTNRAAVARRIAHAVSTQHWNGVNIDLESLTRRDTAGLVDLLGRIRHAVPRGTTLAVDLMAATSAAGYRDWGYDVPRIAATVDHVVLMSYDQHGPWENTPGPVGALPWVMKALTTLLRAGAPRAKVDLGIAGYGYAWRPHSNDQLTDAQARALVARDHAHARWSASAAEWTATLHDGSTVWWSDARSYRARYSYAKAQRLHGVAVWSLGQSDTIRR